MGLPYYDRSGRDMSGAPGAYCKACLGTGIIVCGEEAGAECPCPHECDCSYCAWAESCLALRRLRFEEWCARHPEK